MGSLTDSVGGYPNARKNAAKMPSWMPLWYMKHDEASSRVPFKCRKSDKMPCGALPAGLGDTAEKTYHDSEVSFRSISIIFDRVGCD